MNFNNIRDELCANVLHTCGTIFLTCLLLIGASVAGLIGWDIGQTVYGASAQVTLPSFTVTLNGKQIDNHTRKYPLIVYKDVTYVPMTWYDCRFLGLESDWKAEMGLRITKTGVTGAYYDDLAGSKNSSSKTYTASVSTLAISVNEKHINNSDEQYPLLTFRDITYFPLTWHFTVDEFGWEYIFTNEDGLHINSTTNRNTADPAYGKIIDSMTVNIPLAIHGDWVGACAVIDDYIYYEGVGGKIYASPLSKLSEAQMIHQMPDQTVSETGNESGYPYAKLEIRNNALWLSYHDGSLMLGKDCQFHIVSAPAPKGSGLAFSLDPVVLNTFKFDDVWVQAIGIGPPTGAIINNISVRRNQETEYRKIGDPSLIHSSGYILYDDGYVYTSAWLNDVSDDSKAYLYRTNIATGISQRLSETHLSMTGHGS